MAEIKLSGTGDSRRSARMMATYRYVPADMMREMAEAYGQRDMP